LIASRFIDKQITSSVWQEISDALHSDRPYRPAWPREKVLEHIRSLSGTHFAPEVLEVFFQIYWEITSCELTIAINSNMKS
jgi:response regulator RpfG family c-di-GMP phosphodiesterase